MQHLAYMHVKVQTFWSIAWCGGRVMSVLYKLGFVWCDKLSTVTLLLVSTRGLKFKFIVNLLKGFLIPTLSLILKPFTPAYSKSITIRIRYHNIIYYGNHAPSRLIFRINYLAALLSCVSKLPVN